MIIEQSLSLTQLNKREGINQSLVDYAKIVGHHAGFFLIFSFLVVFLLQDVIWDKGMLIPMLKLYFVVGFATLNYPFFTAGLCV